MHMFNLDGCSKAGNIERAFGCTPIKNGETVAGEELFAKGGEHGPYISDAVRRRDENPDGETIARARRGPLSTGFSRCSSNYGNRWVCRVHARRSRVVGRARMQEQ